MAKRLKGVTQKRQQNWFDIHRSSFEDVAKVYDPFWHCEDVPSFGIKVKLRHFDTSNRPIHLLSLNELWMYLHLARNVEVIEVYEQFAIPLEVSIAIADELEVKHPVYVGTRVPIVQTIDFVADMLDLETGEVIKKAFPVKQPSDANKFRTVEKLKIQEAYAAIEDMEYELITSDVLRTNHSISLQILYRYRELSPLLRKVSNRFLNNLFSELFDDRHERAAHLIKRACDNTGIEYETGISIFYHALWHRKIEMDWSKLLRLEMAASDLGLHPND